MLPALINHIAHLTEIFSSRYFVTRTLTLVIFTHEMNRYHFVLIFPSQKWHFYSSLQSLQRRREARLHSTHMSQGQGGPKNKIPVLLFIYFLFWGEFFCKQFPNWWLILEIFTVLSHDSFFLKKLYFLQRCTGGIKEEGLWKGAFRNIFNGMFLFFQIIILYSVTTQ